MSTDLRRQFPDMKGLSPSNLQYMRAFAAAWPESLSRFLCKNLLLSYRLEPITSRSVLGSR